MICRHCTFLLAFSVMGTLYGFPAFAQEPAKPAIPPAKPSLSTDEKALLNRLQTDTLRTVTTDLTAPTMEGRGTGQPGGDRAAQYLVSRFQKIGLKPLGEEGAYLQKIRFDAVEPLPTTQIAVTGGEKLQVGPDFVPALNSTPDGDTAAELVFVGYGVTNAALGRDDLKGINVAGKIVVALDGLPEGADPKAWAEARREHSLVELAQKGAKGLLLILPTETGYRPVGMYLSRWQISPAREGAKPTAQFPLALVSTAGATKLLAKSSTKFADLLARTQKGDFVSRPLGISATLQVHARREAVTSNNVIGILEGSDAKLKPEAVVFSAHYDAYGKGADSTVYPGAADNALGVAEMMGIAEALATSPQKPRRSVIFLAPTGEEYGLLGARYWLSHPTWPLDKVIADLNFDGIGTETYGPLKLAVGYGREYSTLGTTLQGVTGALGYLLVPDPLPEEGTFQRSDHYAFVQKGIPALMTEGAPFMPIDTILTRARSFLTKDYHQTTDTIRPDWNWEGPKGLAALMLLIGWRIAQSDDTPKWLPSSPYQRPAP